MKILPFTKADLRLSPLLVKGPRNSISGVQSKVLLAYSKGEFKVVDSGGDYILKPVPLYSEARFAADIPANEHTTMQIASKIFGIKTADNELVKFADGEFAYLTRRFDRRKGVSIRQEDLCQVAGRSEESHGSGYKYDFSYEEMADIIRSSVSVSRIELRKVFRQLLFDYIVANGDAHLKNFSIYQSDYGDYVMTPAYDLLCTSLHYSNDLSFMALSLFNGDFMTPEFETLGYYTEADFILLGRAYGLERDEVISLIREFKTKASEVEGMLRESLLSEGAKMEYLRIFRDRLGAFRKVI